MAKAVKNGDLAAKVASKPTKPTRDSNPTGETKGKKYLEFKATKKKDPNSINQLKKRKRDLQRLLSKLNKQDPSPTNDNINQSLIETKKLQQELLKINQLIQQNQDLKLKNELNEKYKYVRFVELKKSLRRKDGNHYYIEYFPINRKYISIYKEDAILAKINEFKEQGLLKKGFQWKFGQSDSKAVESIETIDTNIEQDEFFLD